MDDVKSIHDSIDKALAAMKDGKARTDAKRIVVVHIGVDAKPVLEVDPKTLTNTPYSQQFALRDDGSMTPLKRYDWIEHPEIITVDHWSLG